MHQTRKRNESHDVSIARQVLAAIGLLLLFYALSPYAGHALAEELPSVSDEAYEEASFVILDDPELFLFETDEDEPTDWDAYYEAVANQEVDGEEAAGDAQGAEAPAPEPVDEPTEPVMSKARSCYPTITSVGKTNIKIHGVRSKNKLLEYTIPAELLEADPDFAALMIEAEKYIGYPYVYGASNPKDSFDCSGFVSWVFIHSGVYDTGRRGATGLHTLCNDVASEDVRPGDLVFFQNTMGPDVDGITHVGIYVGNQMMIHAGDPIGFADLTEDKWVKRFYGFGRLPD